MGLSAMSAIKIEASISLEQLLSAVERLPDAEIGRFTEQILALRARRLAPASPADEATLLQRINRTLPPGTQRRCDELLAKRDAETLTAAEHDELLRLSDQCEIEHADRVAALIELAQVRRISLGELMATLGIAPTSHA